MSFGLPDAIAGVWGRPGGDKRRCRWAERFSQWHEQSLATNAPILRVAAWGRTATLGQLSLAGDLRIDHRAELAAALGDSDGCDDASLFLRAWRRWGHSALERVEGDFAVAIWDGGARRLTLARDALGNRPLHYRHCAWGIAFGSMAAPLACLAGESRCDLDRLALLLAFVPELGKRSFLSGVDRVIPGHALVVDEGGHRQLAWWKPRLAAVKMTRSQAIASMRVEIDRAVSAAVATGAPVIAAQLSGGHDSTLVMETAARLIDAGPTLVAITGTDAGDAMPLTADSFDDAAVAGHTARMLGVHHVLVRAKAESPLAATDRWTASDEPMLNPYNLGWIDRTCAAARHEGAEVMLVGLSGNTMVSHDGLDLFSALFRTFKWATLYRQARRLRAKRGTSWKGLAALTIGPWIPSSWWLWYARRRGRNGDRFDDRAFLRRGNSHVRGAIAEARRRGLPHSMAPPRSLGSKARLHEMQWADPGTMNHYVRATHGIELRDPLGARRLVELSLQLGPEHFYWDGESRRLSRALLAGRAPEIVTANSSLRGMQGANWLDGALGALPELTREVECLANDPELTSMFDVPRLRRHLEEWPADGWSDIRQGHVYRGFLTTAICAARFARRVRERDCAALVR